MDDSLEVCTLGGLSMRQSGVPVTSFEVRKEAALLVYLACNRQVHSREVLAELLWEQRTQAQALTNLRGVLAGLRRRLGPFLVITRHSVGLDGSKVCWLDVAELEASLDRASQQWGQAEPLTPAAAHQLEQALALYQGDFLAGFYLREGQGFQAGTLTSGDVQSRAVDVRPQPSLSSLPQPMTAFIGRASELAYLAERLSESDCRLLTLVGPGGIGKTRLALQAAHEHSASFAH